MCARSCSLYRINRRTEHIWPERRTGDFAAHTSGWTDAWAALNFFFRSAKSTTKGFGFWIPNSWWCVVFEGKGEIDEHLVQTGRELTGSGVEHEWHAVYALLSRRRRIMV